MKNIYKLAIILSIVLVLLIMFIHGTIIHLIQFEEYKTCVNTTLSVPWNSTFACDKPGWWFGL